MKTHPKADPVDAYVGQAIRAVRIQKGLSQKSVADAIGVAFQQVQKYETGHNRIAPSRLLRVAEFLEVPVADLFPPQVSAANDIKPYLLEDDDAEFLRDMRKLNKETRNRIRAMMRTIADAG